MILNKAKESVETAAMDLRQRMMFQAESEFIQKVMKWESCTWEQAMDLCIGKSPERHPEYILGYRMADPILLQALYLQLSKKRREQARAFFRETLDDDVAELFDKEYDNFGLSFRKEYKTKGGK